MFYVTSQKGDSGEYLLSTHVEMKAYTSGTIKDKKPDPAAQCVHFVLLSFSDSYFRGNILQSNKYRFCNEVDIFNTLFLICNSALVIQSRIFCF